MESIEKVRPQASYYLDKYNRFAYIRQILRNSPIAWKHLVYNAPERNKLWHIQPIQGFQGLGPGQSILFEAVNQYQKWPGTLATPRARLVSGARRCRRAGHG